MAIYEYQCDKCGEVTPYLHKMSESYNGNKCEHCHDGIINKIMSATRGWLSSKQIYHEGMTPSEFVKRNTDHRD